MLQRAPDDVRIREEAAARCTKKIKRRVLKKQARRARVKPSVKCSLEPGKKKVRRKPLEFFVECTERSGTKSCKDMGRYHSDPEATKEVQEN